MTKLSQLKIDPEFQNQINPPSFEETHQLEMNILKEERVLNPIITWNGYIVDGHTRYQILRKYPFIPFEVIEKEFSSRYEALVWICKNQLGRRNLTPEQKKFLIGKQAEAEKQIKSFHGNQYTLASESGLVQNEPDRTKHGSRSKVAAEHGTSESYVYRAEQFAKGVEAAEEAVPGAQKEILSGKIRATDREISSIAKVPKEKRPEVVAELRKPKAKRDSSITDSYSSPSKGNEFITTFKQDIQGHAPRTPLCRAMADHARREPWAASLGRCWHRQEFPCRMHRKRSDGAGSACADDELCPNPERVERQLFQSERSHRQTLSLPPAHH